MQPKYIPSLPQFFGAMMLAFLGNVYADDGGPRIFDEFNDPLLNRDVWCPCQINNQSSPLRFQEEMNTYNDHYLRIMADEASLGGNKCRYEAGECAKKAPIALESSMPMSIDTEYTAEAREFANEEAGDLDDPLGPSLLKRLRMAAQDNKLLNLDLQPLPALTSKRPTHLQCGSEPNSKAYCTEDVLQRVAASGEEDLCIQRQELRLNGKKRRPHATKEPLWYSMRFRMPTSVEDRCNSVRWVTAQWKHNSSALAGGYNAQNPFLAQRFDDGVLHVTVQDEGCRCLVASAHDPLREEQEKWIDGPVPSRLCAAGNQECTARFTLEYGENPVLTNPLGIWTTMQYFVRPGQNNDGEIIIQQDERHIVTIRGNIGYRIGDESKNHIKFKFGHYRDYMPFHAEMDVYSVKISDTP
ncbi:hypothetical protein IWQ55_001355 [Labrenzia sp. EL_208]|nr:hypothetical protein [Labrenzia sp. EL_132]MBG6228157.1 hypothetical protein [Labrenzia sp. EL_208]